MAGLLSLITREPTTFDPQSADAYIVPLDHAGVAQDPDYEKLAFQYYPSQLTLSSETGFSATKALGLSHELQKWGAKPSRTLEMTTVFTNDEPLVQPSSVLADIPSVEPAYATGFSGTGDPARDRASPDIAAAVSWIQMFQFPTYKAGSQLAIPPRRLLLVLVGSMIGLGMTDTIRCVLARANFNYKSVWPTGVPRVVEVSLSFIEIIQVGMSIQSHNATSYARVAKASQARYTITPRA